MWFLVFLPLVSGVALVSPNGRAPRLHYSNQPISVRKGPGVIQVCLYRNESHPCVQEFDHNGHAAAITSNCRVYDWQSTVSGEICAFYPYFENTTTIEAIFYLRRVPKKMAAPKGLIAIYSLISREWPQYLWSDFLPDYCALQALRRTPQLCEQVHVINLVQENISPIDDELEINTGIIIAGLVLWALFVIFLESTMAYSDFKKQR